ncbi:hypothetical protein PHYNN_115 [Pantoea phage Phynn]|nr:hypothetical protein PHYNN_115 [Pantoea phage Phynn]
MKAQQPQHSEELQALEAMNDLTEELQDSPVYAQAQRKADQFMRKNRREWKRLNNRASDALLSGDKEAYSYAIRKMRDMMKQPYNEKLIESMWVSSRAAVIDMIRSAQRKVA